ncbi:MAG: hypothetical protein N7Q72_05355, partial [Spiroplasma sp. Tabriz.8]|nr:hypothetical protein [Spiroplasma sp. Tabriz.8]
LPIYNYFFDNISQLYFAPYDLDAFWRHKTGFPTAATLIIIIIIIIIIILKKISYSKPFLICQ